MNETTPLQPPQYFITGAPVLMTQQGMHQYATSYVQQWPLPVAALPQITYTTDSEKRSASEDAEHDVSKRQHTAPEAPHVFSPAPILPQVFSQPPTNYSVPTLATPLAPDTSISCYDMFDEEEEMNPANKPPPDFSTMSAGDRRRYERNVREQQRSYKISKQIKVLKIVLVESGVNYKPNKFSILMSVADYIKQLQSRAIMLDAEHRKLVATIRETSEMVNSGETPSEETVEPPLSYVSSIGSDPDMLFVQGLDYKAVFEQCTAGLGIASLDGRILACNSEFQALSGLSKDELLKQSLFALMQNHKDVFEAMGSMLKEPGPKPILDVNGEPTSETKPEYWSGTVLQKDQSNLNMNISLTRTPKGHPKFFNCALSADI